MGAPRADGYHPLATVYQAVSVYDEVHAVWADPDDFAVVVSGEGADLVPLDDSNLAVRAAKLLARTHAPNDSLGARLSIKKSIPVAGLAGGSANGAAAPLACAVLWDLDVPAEGMRPSRLNSVAMCHLRCLVAPPSAVGEARRWRQRSPKVPTTGCWDLATTGCPRQRSIAGSMS